MYQVTHNKKQKGFIQHHFGMGKSSKAQSGAGFTLIEAVVAATIFALVVTSILSTYLFVLRINTRTRAQRAVAQNARFITEFLSKEIRNGHIDYEKYLGNVPTTTTSLWLLNQNNETENIYLADSTSPQNVLANSSGCQSGITICDVMILKPGVSGTATTLNSGSVKITNFEFIISPSTNPFTASKTVNEQPHVTAVIQLTANLGSRDEVKMDLQSTFSELYYPGR